MSRLLQVQRNFTNEQQHFNTQFWRLFIMKKNLFIMMAQYGELLNRIGG